jgi:MerR family transcriptional regulator/heat shock protein HspR
MSKRVTPKNAKRVTDDRAALFVISVAAELAGVHPQTLRLYERKGLVNPARTAGNSRRYSARDIERVRLIQSLTQDQGMSLAAAEITIRLQRELDAARDRLDAMRREMAEARQEMEAMMEQARRARGEMVLLRDLQQFPGFGGGPHATR